MDTSRIIHAPVSVRRFAVTTPITQYDYGYLLLPEGVELPTIYEIDFSNDEEKGTSLTVYGGSEGAEVPEELIRTGKDVYAFYYFVGDGFGKTEFTWKIPNNCRPSRDGQTPTPTQQSSIDQLIARSNEAVEQAEQSASDASTSAQNASADAERAEEARTDAQNYATQAEQARDDARTYANNASASATASAQSASQSAQIKADVEDLVDDAQGYAQASERSASASANSASQAQGYAQSASASAQSASGYASQADISANTASTKASEASTSAQTATQKATESAQSASQALSYKTDAESAKTASQTAQGLAESAKDSAISAKNDAESARDDAESARDEAQQAVASISGALADKAPVITDTASGSIASFSDGADDLPLKSLVVDINPVQDLHGQENPYPAGGGKNLFRTTASSKTQNGVTWTVNDDGSVTVSGTAEDYTDLSPFGSAKVDSSMGTVTIKVDGISVQSNIACGPIMLYDANNVSIYRVTSGSATITTYTVDLSQYPTVDHIDISLKRNNTGAVTNGTVKVQIEKGSTATDWTPYENICPISGWTQVQTTRNGSNLWNPVPNGMAKWNPSIGEQIPALTTNFTTFENDVLAVNTNWAWNGNAFITNKLLTGRTYRVTGVINSNSNHARIGVYTLDANRRVVRIVRYVTNNGNMDVSVTMGASDVYICVSAANATDNEAVTITNPCISESGVYEPHTGRSITIQLGQTVYGGKLDVLSGELVIDRAMVDLGTLDWTYYVGNSFAMFFTPAINDIKKSAGWCGICSIYGIAVTDIQNIADKMISNGYGDGRIRVKDSRFTDVNSFVADVRGQTLVYELATPIEIQLDSHTLNSLYGANNLWADSGDTEVEYRADTKAYIAKKIAEAISALS